MYLATGPYGKIIPMAPVSLIVVGAGQRGTGYARWARRHPERSTVVAVAEPSQVRRVRLAAEHGIPAGNAVTDWTELAGRGRLADAVLICTQDRMHAEPAEAFAALGYHILLEKPMAPDEAGCRRIVAAVEKAGVMLAVGHVMRYTPYTRAVKQLADSGQLGDIMSVQHLEPVGFWHQAHSYVRGNWRRADLATSMLMAKSCHDRCVACSVEPDCPYSAPRLYRGLLDRGARGWPLSVVIDDYSAEALDADEALDEALRTGPYGRCVYACDNDAVDHQVVTLEFPGATTAAFTMTAFTQPGHRRTRLFGTRAELTGDGETIRVYDFLTRAERLITPEAAGGMNAGEGHGGGDAGLMDAFTAAVATGRRELISSGPRESLASHLAVFAAERARRNGTVETIPP
jgi:predicted dehydrogenase